MCVLHTSCLTWFLNPVNHLRRARATDGALPLLLPCVLQLSIAMYYNVCILEAPTFSKDAAIPEYQVTLTYIVEPYRNVLCLFYKIHHHITHLFHAGSMNGYIVSGTGVSWVPLCIKHLFFTLPFWNSCSTFALVSELDHSFSVCLTSLKPENCNFWRSVCLQYISTCLWVRARVARPARGDVGVI